MKFQRNDKYTTIAIYAFLVLVGVIVTVMVLGNIGIAFGWLTKIIGYIQPVIYGFVFAFLLNPLLRRLDDRLLPKLFGEKLKPKPRRVIALILTYLIALLVLILFFALVVPEVVFSVRSIASNFSSYVKYIQSLYGSLTEYLRSFNIFAEGTEAEVVVGALVAKVIDTMEGLLDSAYGYMTQAVVPILTGAGRITAGLLNMLLGIIVSIYILMDREKLFAQLKKIGKAIFPQHVFDLFFDIAQDANRIFSGFVIGKVIDSVIIGLLCFVLLAILGFPYAVLISVVVGVFNIIPYFGPIIGAIPGVFILLVNEPAYALWFLIIILALQQFDGNILGPKILGDTVGLSALWIIFSIMLFSGLFGIIGMFIGVPLFAIIYSLIKRFIAFLLNRKGEPTSTREYDSERNPLIK